MPNIYSIKNCLLEYGKQLIENRRYVDFVQSEKNPKHKPANELLLNNDFALLLAVIYDQGQPAEQAWRYPYELCKHINKKSPQDTTEAELLKYICNKELEELDNIFYKTVYKLRDWRTSCPDTIRATNLVMDKYQGKTSNIWKRDNPNPKTIIKRLKEFSGIAQKKSTMMANILYRDLKRIDGNNLHQIDVSYDRHIKRIFLRTGLSDKGSEKAIVDTAKSLNPEYPGALDLPSWEIGRRFCDNKAPDCDGCPIEPKCSTDRIKKYHVK